MVLPKVLQSLETGKGRRVTPEKFSCDSIFITFFSDPCLVIFTLFSLTVPLTHCAQSSLCDQQVIAKVTLWHFQE